MLATTSSILFVLASAHIQLKSPAARGADSTGDVDEVGELTGPCGAGLTTAGSRTTVPLTGFALSLEIADGNAQTVVKGAVGANPSSFSTQVGSSSASLSTASIPIDFSKLGAKAGDQVTLQVAETSADGTKFICADLTIAGTPSGSDSGSGSGTGSGSGSGTGSGSSSGTGSASSSAAPSTGTSSSIPDASSSSGSGNATTGSGSSANNSSSSASRSFAGLSLFIITALL